MRSVRSPAYFLGTLDEPPQSAEEIRQLLRCSRATAYRWLKFIREFEGDRHADGKRIKAAFNQWGHTA